MEGRGEARRSDHAEYWGEGACICFLVTYPFLRAKGAVYMQTNPGPLGTVS